MRTYKEIDDKRHELRKEYTNLWSKGLADSIEFFIIEQQIDLLDWILETKIITLTEDEKIMEKCWYKQEFECDCFFSCYHKDNFKVDNQTS